MLFEDFLIWRPLLTAMRPQPGGAFVLLIDELDRADEPFEAFLREALSDFQGTIPELGTIMAPEPPIVILTSNRTREVHDALKRRCFFHWVDYPSFDRELAILRSRVPEAAEAPSREVVGFVLALRGEDRFKHPSAAETIDWAKCLLALDVIALSARGDRLRWPNLVVICDIYGSMSQCSRMVCNFCMRWPTRTGRVARKAGRRHLAGRRRMALPLARG